MFSRRRPDVAVKNQASRRYLPEDHLRTPRRIALQRCSLYEVSRSLRWKFPKDGSKRYFTRSIGRSETRMVFIPLGDLPRAISLRINRVSPYPMGSSVDAKPSAVVNSRFTQSSFVTVPRTSATHTPWDRNYPNDGRGLFITP